ncbi:Maf family protein [Caldisalinibacter kiritimatiensis]|uniref:dTTP/UTP pyrophosphatase n=1 Tax=Caldisalinibacter kiritimatiensis TaxID=1304284 RepID=R1CBZ6_9FIRM|nr:Maf family protein [Caldisalinibacter kiritimatiensis]EOC99829.1 Septum formation protein Maf [Caldisalinibacter kiritimatiensis]
MRQIVLASGSPRRKEILSNFNVDIEVITSDIDEKVNNDEKPEIVAMTLAFEKAYDVANKVEKGKIILAADTIVYHNHILGKPEDESEAFKMLKALSGKEHSVITGICIMESGTYKKVVDCGKTQVKFKDLTNDKIKRYLATEEYKDKAGAYGIQGYGALLVERIKGSYLNVVGLPISKVEYLLEKHFNFKIL